MEVDRRRSLGGIVRAEGEMRIGRPNCKHWAKRAVVYYGARGRIVHRRGAESAEKNK
jgi:hypothetical protein